LVYLKTYLLLIKAEPGRGMPQHLLGRESTSLTCGCELQLSTQLDLGLNEDVEGSSESRRFTRKSVAISVAIGATWRDMTRHVFIFNPFA